MEKFKELSLVEICEINGGMDSQGMQPIYAASETWWWKGLTAMQDAVDFVSGIVDGYSDGFKNASKSW